jgi:uncharacterized membrane protein YfcA
MPAELGDVSTTTMILIAIGLFFVGAMAGFIDAIAGGGGLITVPALLFVGLPPHLALGTNKGQSLFGSSAALLRFAHSPLLDAKRARVSIVPALVAAALGVVVLQKVPSDVLKPVVMVLLVGVALFMMFYRPPTVHEPRLTRPAWMAIAVSFVIAFYDGFFGPGTGMFLILAYAWWWRDPLHSASANAKVVNCCSNWGSWLAFLWFGKIIWLYAVPMGVGQLCGGFLGAHMTIRVGRGLVRYVGIVVSLALIARLAWQMLGG